MSDPSWAGSETEEDDVPVAAAQSDASDPSEPESEPDNLSSKIPIVPTPLPQFPPEKRKGSSKMPSSEPGLEHEVGISITITPSSSRYNVPLAHAVQLQNVRTLLHAVNGALQAGASQGVRLLHGRIMRFIVCIEAGKRRGKYHLQGLAIVRTIEHNVELVMYAISLLVNTSITAVGLGVRIVKLIKPANIKDEAWMLGYMQKDAGLEHSQRCLLGYDAAALERGTNVYRTKGGSNTYSSDKINPFPEKDRRAYPLNPANLLQVARWFVLKEGMRPLLPVASIAVQTAWMLQSNNYFLETKLINGSAGAPLCEARLEALNVLNNDVRSREHTSLVRCVLYGPDSMEESAGARRVQSALQAITGLPSRQQCDAMTLAAAKRFCRNMTGPQSDIVMQPAARIGVAVVVDLAQTNASRHIINLLNDSGFQVNPLLASDQCKNACGHIAEMSAVMLRSLGQRFDELRLDRVEAVNTHACVAMQEMKLGRQASSVEVPERLSDQQILHLATLDNPDGRGTEPTWLPGPGPINALEDALKTSTAAHKTLNEVHIMVVNSVRVDRLTAAFAGQHWMAVAWQIRNMA